MFLTPWLIFAVCMENGLIVSMRTKCASAFSINTRHSLVNSRVYSYTCFVKYAFGGDIKHSSTEDKRWCVTSLDDKLTFVDFVRLSMTSVLKSVFSRGKRYAHRWSFLFFGTCTFAVESNVIL